MVKNKVKRIVIPAALILSFCLCGCSTLSSAKYSELPVFTKKDRKIKGRFGAMAVDIKDFLGNEAYEEDMDTFKEKAEKYIADNPGTSEPVKNSLRQLKITEGLPKEAAKLLLSKPVKVSQTGPASETWVYRARKLEVFSIFIMPLFPVHESYRLYFKDGTLAKIERRYLTQTVYQNDATGPELPGD